MEEKKELSQRELAEIGKSGYEITGVTPDEFQANIKARLVTSRRLAYEFAKFFYQMTDDVAGFLVEMDALNKRIVAWVFLQNNKFSNENKFKAVIQSNQVVRGTSIVDVYMNTRREQSAYMTLTDDAKNVFDQFLFDDPGIRYNKNGKWVPKWNQLYSEKTNNRNIYGNNPNSVYNFGVLPLDPRKILAKMFGEKASETDYFEYTITPRIALPGGSYPNILLDIQQANGETINETANEIGWQTQNELGFVTPHIR